MVHDDNGEDFRVFDGNAPQPIWTHPPLNPEAEKR
jgi:hypothetical protein